MRKKTMLRFALVFFCITGPLLFFECNSKIKDLGGACQKYTTFFKSIWRFDKATSIYSFENNPEWWYSDKYIIESCLVGLTEKQVQKIFGIPSGYCNYNQFRQMTFCLDQECLDKVMFPRGKWVQIIFDSTGVASAVHTSPPLQQRKPPENDWD